MSLIDSDYSFFGVSATYTPDGGSPASVTVVITEDFDSGEESGLIRHEAEISVRISEVAARPGYRDTFVVTDGEGNNQTWTIVDGGVRENMAFQDFGGEWICKVSRDERPIL